MLTALNEDFYYFEHPEIDATSLYSINEISTFFRKKGYSMVAPGYLLNGVKLFFTKYISRAGAKPSIGDQITVYGFK